MNKDLEKLRFNRKAAHLIIKLFRFSSLYPRIVCLILHGSGLYCSIPRKNHERDLDLELILTGKDPKDFQIIKKIISKLPVKIECQVRYKEEIINPNSLILLSGYKIFMYFAYANGFCLLGKNIYKSLIKKIGPDIVYQSSLISAQIHYKDIRKFYLGSGSVYEINKNIMRFFKEICVLEHFLNYKNVGTEIFFRHEANAFVGLLSDGYSEIISPEVKIMMLDFLACFKNNKFFNNSFLLTKEILHLFETKKREANL